MIDHELIQQSLREDASEGKLDRIVTSILYDVLDIPGVRDAVILHAMNSSDTLDNLIQEYSIHRVGDIPFYVLWERIQGTD